MFLYLNSHYYGAPIANTANNFYVYFAKPIEFIGEFETSLIQMDYDSYIWTFTNDDKIKVVVQKEIKVNKRNSGNNRNDLGIIIDDDVSFIPQYPNIKINKVQTSPSFAKKNKLHELTNNSLIYMGWENKSKKEFDENDFIIVEYDEEKIINLGLKTANNILEITEILRDTFSNNVKDIHAQIDNDRIRINIDDPKIKYIEFLNHLNVALGFSESKLFERVNLAKYKPQFERNTQSIYIYLDFIEDSLVSNVSANLLKILPYKPTHSHIVHNVKIPQYVGICKKYITSAHVTLRNEYGELFPFWDNCKTMIVLHIREK